MLVVDKAQVKTKVAAALLCQSFRHTIWQSTVPVWCDALCAVWRHLHTAWSARFVLSWRCTWHVAFFAYSCFRRVLAACRIL